MLLERLTEVVLDSQQGIETRHRLLEDQPEIRPPQLAELLPRQADEISPSVEDLPVGDRAFGQQPENAAAERGLATA